MQTIERKTHLFDAQGQVLGRLATQIAKVLSGKNKVSYIAHVDAGDFVVVLNSDAVRVTGNKLKNKMYHRFSGYPGGITSLSLEQRMQRDSRLVIKDAVKGMLPKNSLSKNMLKRLEIMKDGVQTKKIDVDHTK